jgi:hypothetical protein
MPPMTFRHALVGATALSALAGAAAPALATPQDDHAAPARLRAQYERRYREVSRLGGEPGRDIARDGVKGHGGSYAATAADVRRSLRVLARIERALAGTATATGTATASASPGSGPAASAGGSTSLPACTWAPESGGNYNAVNSSSGARGKYQIMPSTYAAYGGDGSWSPADQDRVAARIYAATGGSAWVNC